MTDKNKAFFSLMAAAIVFMILPIVPFGNSIQRPFILLTTYVHEIGHGLAAWAQGANFLKFELFTSGGGVATVSGVNPGWGQGLVSAAGLLAPSIMGGLFILAGSSRKSASIILISFSIFMLLSCVFWIRSIFTLLVVGGLGATFLYFGIKTKASWHQVLIQFFAVHMLVDTLTRTMRYLFTNTFERDGLVKHSDTANLASALGGSYWMWGSIIGLVALLIFYLSFRHVYFRK